MYTGTQDASTAVNRMWSFHHTRACPSAPQLLPLLLALALWAAAKQHKSHEVQLTAEVFIPHSTQTKDADTRAKLDPSHIKEWGWHNG